jgi:hypothetical protein
MHYKLVHVAPLQLMHTCHKLDARYLNMTTNVSFGDLQSRMNEFCLGISGRDSILTDTLAESCRWSSDYPRSPRPSSRWSDRVYATPDWSGRRSARIHPTILTATYTGAISCVLKFKFMLDIALAVGETTAYGGSSTFQPICEKTF